MDLLKFTKEIAIPPQCPCPCPCPCACSYNGMAFDGCNYYLLASCAKKIIKTDLCYSFIDCFETRREYSCICYDSKECCFWAGAEKCHNKIFKLNSCLQEIACIHVNGGCEDCEDCGGCKTSGVITGISYNCCNDTLLVAFSECIVEVLKDCEEVILQYQNPTLWIIGICSVSPYSIISAIKNKRQCLILLNAENELLCCSYVPQNYNLLSVIFNPCQKDCNLCHGCHSYIFNLLVNKDSCYPYIIQAVLDHNAIEFHPCKCNDFICKKCGDEPPFKPGDACTDVIESVALMEASLSHILNAEGEKLQKVLASTSDIGQIMCVNKEINRTIINATQLEQALYAKLSAVLDCKNCDRLCESGYDSGCESDCES